MFFMQKKEKKQNNFFLDKCPKKIFFSFS